MAPPRSEPLSDDPDPLVGAPRGVPAGLGPVASIDPVDAPASEEDAEATDEADESQPDEPSDHDLIRAAQTGDEDAFATLVRRHERRAFRVARNLVPSREDALDLAQEAFLRVFRSLDRFDFRHEFTTWLYRIVTNLGIDHLRKRRPAVSTTALSGEDDVEFDFPDVASTAPTEFIESEETADRVRACIDSLAPHFQAVLTLRELEGLPCTEIAEIVGATHVTVRWRLHRGRKLFQDEWERRERSAENAARVTRAARNELAGPNAARRDT
jgi:RNA polymerase sigma-70 factor (ECF subfamily)